MVKTANQPMDGVTAQPLHRAGVCQMHRDGHKCPAAGKKTRLWRVTWGDGVTKDLCTACMASLVHEESWVPEKQAGNLSKALADLLGLVRGLDGGEHDGAPEIAAARALVARKG